MEFLVPLWEFYIATLWDFYITIHSQICNQPDLNNWDYNDEGRGIGIAKAEVIDRCSEALKREILKRLKKHFDE